VRKRQEGDSRQIAFFPADRYSKEQSLQTACADTAGLFLDRRGVSGHTTLFILAFPLDQFLTAAVDNTAQTGDFRQ
jgi:hypothetical protein